MFFMFLYTDIAKRVEMIFSEATCPSGQRRVGGLL